MSLLPNKYNIWIYSLLGFLVCLALLVSEGKSLGDAVETTCFKIGVMLIGFSLLTLFTRSLSPRKRLERARRIIINRYLDSFASTLGPADQLDMPLLRNVYDDIRSGLLLKEVLDEIYDLVPASALPIKWELPLGYIFKVDWYLWDVCISAGIGDHELVKLIEEEILDRAPDLRIFSDPGREGDTGRFRTGARRRIFRSASRTSILIFSSTSVHDSYCKEERNHALGRVQDGKLLQGKPENQYLTVLPADLTGGEEIARDRYLNGIIVKSRTMDPQKITKYAADAVFASSNILNLIEAKKMPNQDARINGTGPGSEESKRQGDDFSKEKKKEIIKILFLAANPSNSTRLKLDCEIREIDLALRQSEFRNRFKIVQHWAVRISDLQRCLLQHEPDIVHFSGHGSDSSEIILVDDQDSSYPVSKRALSNLFKILKENIRCVILNACYSEKQARSIAQHIDCVIGMSCSISDLAAIRFATSFYQALGYGKDIKTAYDLGCLQIDLERLDEHERPKLLAIKCLPEKIQMVEDA